MDNMTTNEQFVPKYVGPRMYINMMDFSNDRDALLNYYQDLLINNQISACKRRKLSDSDPGANDLLSEETRNRESSLDSPSSTSSTASSEQGSDSDNPPLKDVTKEKVNSIPNHISEETKVDDVDLPQQSGPEQGSYECPQCEKSFAYMGNLKRHIKMHHGEYRPFKCNLCTKRFWGNDSLEQHFKRVHTQERPYACAHCEKKYSVCYDLQKHVRAVHGKDIDWEGDIPTRPDTEVQGTHKVTGIKTVHLEQLNYKCKFCSRGFATVNGLGVHLKMHFRCKICLKGFNTEESLKIHMKKAHDMGLNQEYVL
ncbi:KRAB [Mytilus coruscus]|uniref:KRAB n=1 Tax=Mytilus coruscus TaxID=42192 RepID=A0A6J8CFR1_MYTCO|nr:KRAB [Mytilus coruscus]